MFFDKHYSSTCMRYRKSCPNICNSPTERCPEYTPDFTKLAESYGAKGIRVTKENEIAAAFETAKNTLKVPTVIEFMIEPEENVMPIVPPGNALDDTTLVQHCVINGEFCTCYFCQFCVVVNQRCHRIASFLRLVLTKISGT